MEPSQNPPRSGPRRIGQLVDIGVGTYTDIVTIYGPAEALAGEQVTIQVVVKNLYSIAIYIAVTGRYDGVDITFSPSYATVDAGETYTFTASFSMPNKDIRLDAWSFYWAEPTWYEDDHEYVGISLKAIPAPEFAGFRITEYTT
ncbi:hypothetical protein ES703_42415 [subsurface metagenome]